MVELAQRLLVVAAHPDDEVLGCGGTIARVSDAEGDVRVVFLAEGVTARYQSEEFERKDVREASLQRNENAARALAQLGVAADAVYVNTRPCCRLDGVPLIDLVKEIEGHIDQFRPDVLATHAAHDVNIDHVLAHRAVLAAVRPVNAAHPRTVVSFEVLSSTEWNPAAPFAPSIFVDITATIGRKLRALSAYEDEMRPPPHPRSEHAIRGLAAYRGAQSGLTYAEGFSLVRAVGS